MTPTRFLSAVLGAILMSLSIATHAQEIYLPGDKFTDDLIDGGKGPEMVVVPTGQLVLGGGRVGSDPGALVIDIAQPFAISTTEVTAGMYRQFLASTRSADLKSFDVEDDNLPISGISWDRANAFVHWLSHQTGHYYSLPSSTQWEYAARAGSQKLYTWGDEVGKGNANCTDCATPFQGVPAPVASFKPNHWGLYDVQGNVWEWTQDCMDPNTKPPLNGMPQLFGNCDSRELRGGSAESDAWSIRLNSRASASRKARSSDVGMRVVMQVPQ